MSLKDKLGEELKTALRSGDQFKVDVLRLLNSAIHNQEIAKKSKTGSGELTDEEVTAVLGIEAKKRRESIEVFRKGNRSDLAGKEEKELEIIQNYLPQQLSPEETEKAVKEILERSGAKDFGGAMKAVMAELKGKIDGKLTSEIIKKYLEG